MPGSEFTTFLQPVDRLLLAGLDGTALRQRVLAHNLANVETPGYRRYDVDFRQILARAEGGSGVRLRRTHPRHLEGVGRGSRGSAVIREAGSAVRNDGNNVDLDREMAFLAQNALRYNSLTQLMAARLQLIRTAVREGR